MRVVSRAENISASVLGRLDVECLDDDSAVRSSSAASSGVSVSGERVMSVSGPAVAPYVFGLRRFRIRCGQAIPGVVATAVLIPSASASAPARCGGHTSK